jgi:hypothetical protein
MTGGGRIDYPPGSAQKNPPASHQYETFGAHVVASGVPALDGSCPATGGALQWIDHRPEMRVNGHPLNLHATAVDSAKRAMDTGNGCSDGAVHWGGKLRVQNTGQENLDFEVWDCDNGEPGAGHDGFAISVNDSIFGMSTPNYHVKCFVVTPAAPTCYLTGGNRQFHPTIL